ncbi:HD-GYP domain-containing protein [Paenibacillus eucommiae]|uniref:Nucleotidyltransferase with HDIG domain n=1 Tax=Paenibacillus eucommiae TaxID=1355755 RepID=A0ABS4J7R1_9BACL|nr:HD-GYP domain-containing protein [Paenibacillus eucommiae]MBP1995889.1 putative nucleotidyltransferase with HDIG domain [Paenibacillus eucommiae]
MRIHVLQLQAADRLISDTFNSVGLNVLSAGTFIEPADIQKLILHDIEYVDISPRGATHTFEIESAIILNQNQLEQEMTFADAITGIKDLFRSADLEGVIRQEIVEASFNPLIHSFQQQKDVVSLLLSLNSKDDYTYQHSVQVGMLSYYIAKWLHKSEEEALLIGKAGYLHDIGKCRIDNTILKKPGRLTESEYNEIKKHTTYGFEIIQQSFHEECLSLTALQHHERLDGKGYPHGIKGPDIHPYAKIVAVADIYSAMISNRVYQEKKDLLFVLKELHRMSFGELDPRATQVFIQHMIPNFIGKKVVLSDGRKGIIVMTNPSDYFKPLVQIGEDFINLSEEAHLEIELIAM